MKRKRKRILSAAAICFALAVAFQNAPQDYKLLFEKAKFAMETKGDLQGAIKLFQEIVTKYPKEKEYASKAQLYIGLCYEKLGNSEAVKAYELVLRNFADRPEEVAVARERLAALRQETGAATSVISLPLGELYIEAYAVSPDGTKIVGLNYDSGENIVFHDTVTNQTHFLTHFDNSEESYWADVPVWSPDGKEIAYEQSPNKPGPQRSEIRITNLEGKSRLLWSTDDGDAWPFDWLSDGSAILCIWQRKDKSFTIGLVPVGGGAFKSLCAVHGGPGGPWGSSSPDGRYIVFTEGQTGSRDIRIISIDGEYSRMLIDHPANDTHPLWSPDGKHIVFNSNRQGGDALWCLAMKDGQAVGQPFMIEEIPPRADMLNWTSRGLAFFKSINITDIYIQPIDPETNRPAGPPRLYPHGLIGNNSSLRWSPDGKYVAFVSNAVDRLGQVRIVVQPFEGGKAREFLAPIYVWDPYMHTLAWHPDGRGLGFATFAMNSDARQATVLLLDIATGEWKTHLLPDIPYSHVFIEWSSDGRSLIYTNHHADNATGLIERDLETGSERYIYRPEKGKGYEFSSLRRSRDNKWLVFHQDDVAEPGSAVVRQIMALEFETGRVRTICSGTNGAGIPVWSPDGKNLLVISGLESWAMGMGRELGIVPVAGGLLESLKIDLSWPAGPGFRHGFVSPDWSPDGKNIAFTARSVKEEVYLKKSVIPKDRE